MSLEDLARWTAWDKAHSWHPFTQMRDWTDPSHQPLFLSHGQGEWLFDYQGNRYLDGNSTIWTNLHGHRHPLLDKALQEQLARIAHVSALGFSHGPGAELAKALVGLHPPDSLTRVFFSDDGSTAIECALRMALQYHQLTDQPERRTFAAFDQAYHGDTLAAASLGGITTFAGRIRGFGLGTLHFPDPDALAQLPEAQVRALAGVVIEPLVQGSAGMRIWPAGTLRKLRQWCDQNGVLLILDEVMTGFGRTGTMFAYQQEDVIPDFMCLAKGLTAGYLPMAATLTRESIYEAFLGGFEELKTFFYGHSYTANPLGCAVALASLQVFEEEQTLVALKPKIEAMRELLLELKTRNPRHVGEVRQCGFIAGIDLLQDAPRNQPFPWQNQTGARVCMAARAHGLLTRPIRDTIVLMPPLCTEIASLHQGVDAMQSAIISVCGS